MERRCASKNMAVEERPYGRDRRVEALEVPGLEETAVVRGERDELVGFGEGGGEWFFNQQIEPGGEQGSGGGRHVRPWGTQRLAASSARARGQQIGDRREGRDAKLRGGGFARRGDGVDDGGELHGFAGTFELTPHPQVVAAERAGADDGDACGDGQGELLAGGGFDGLAAACIQLEQVGDLIFALGGRRSGKAGGAGGFGAYVGVGGDELQQVERDVFRCGGRKRRWGTVRRYGGSFHGSMLTWRRAAVGAIWLSRKTADIKPQGCRPHRIS